MRKTIAVDVDDVLAAHAQAFVDFSNARWGTSLTVDDYSDDWAILWNLDRNNEAHRLEISDRASAFFADNTLSMPHDESAHDVLVRLKEKYDLIIVTARRQMIKGETLAWIQQKFPGVFEEDKIFFAGFYDTTQAESAHKNKGELLKALGADYLIDDQPKHCNGATEQGLQAILFGAYGWQEKEPVHEGVIRLKNWHEVHEYFASLRKEESGESK